MKRIITLMMALALVFGAVANSSAADIKAKGSLTMEYAWMDNTDFSDENASEDDFVAQQRFRTQIDIVASENLSGVVFFEIDHAWGQGGGATAGGDRVGAAGGGALGADGVNIETKRAYLDWTVPNTALSVRMGIQGMALPSAVAGSPILDDDVAALVATYKFNDTFSMTGFWARPYDGQQVDTDGAADDEIDLFGIIGGINLDGMTITPWAMYGAIGGEAAGIEGLQGLFAPNAPAGDRYVILSEVTGAPAYSILYNGTEDLDSSDAYWLGLAYELNLFDPIVFSLDAVYGKIDGGDLAYNTAQGNATSFNATGAAGTGSYDDVLDREGWMVAAKLSYKMDMATPGIIGWYASGEDDDIMNGSERLPVISGGFVPTTFGFDGYACGSVTATGDLLGVSNEGKWALGLLIEDIKIIDDLTSQFRVVYVEGTNDHDVLDSLATHTGLTKADMVSNMKGTFMTDKDHAWEVNFDHNYNIYENLAMIVELGYVNLDLDEDTWGLDQAGATDYDSDAWKASILFQYTF